MQKTFVVDHDGLNRKIEAMNGAAAVRKWINRFSFNPAKPFFVGDEEFWELQVIASCSPIEANGQTFDWQSFFVIKNHELVHFRAKSLPEAKSLMQGELFHFAHLTALVSMVAAPSGLSSGGDSIKLLEFPLIREIVGGVVEVFLKWEFERKFRVQIGATSGSLIEEVQAFSKEHALEKVWNKVLQNGSLSGEQKFSEVEVTEL